MKKVIRLTESDLTKIVKRVITESIDDDKYYDKIVSILEPPYFQILESIGIPKNQYETILSRIFDQPVTVGDWFIKDMNGKRVYEELKSGYWEKREYDENGNIIYIEKSDGSWVKREYDKYGNETYSENSNGFWVKSLYDFDLLIYFEKSDGFWEKREYDNDGNEIYSEDSNGFWVKSLYDDNGNEIYYENSNGEKWGIKKNK